MNSPQPLRGIALMLLAIICFGLHDATVKLLSASIPLLIVIWFRYTVHCLVMLLTLGPRMGRGLIRTQRPWAMTLRGLTLVATTLFGMAAFRSMPLAETTAVIFLSPLIVSLAAGPLLGEKISPWHGLAIALGFCGVLLIARPGSDIAGSGLLYAIGAAISLSIYQLQTRQLAHGESTQAMLFFTALTGTVVMSLGAPFYWESFAVDLPHGSMLLSLGLVAATGHFLMTRAFRHAAASVLSPILYVQLAWVTLLGWLIFDHLPDTGALTGMLVIVASSLGLILLERRKAQVLAPQ